MEEGTQSTPLSPEKKETSDQKQPQLHQHPQPYQSYPYYVNYNVCPTCGKPVYYFPYYYHGTKESKKILGIPAWGLVVIIVVAFLIFACFVANFLMFGFFGPFEDIETYSTEVIISEGGHFKYSLGYFYDENEVTFNVSSKDGKNFDVYFMDEDQYQNAYGSSNTSTIAFSAFYSNENISQIIDTFELQGQHIGFKEIYFVIDNRDTSITPEDATPEGMITVDVKITIKTVFYVD